jgi:hypothetical protein
MQFMRNGKEKVTDLMILKEEQARIQRRIKRCKLANYKVEQVGGYINNDEVFVQLLGYTKYYISNYGRMISTKGKQPCLLKRSRKRNGYYYYQLWDRRRKKSINIYMHRAVADTFCPNLFREEKGQIDVHHMNHGQRVNRPDNLLWLPKYLHRYCNDIGSFGIWREKNARNLHPLEIVALTGLDLKDFILASKREEPIKKVGKWSIYDIKGYQIALEIINESNNNLNKKKLA